ncbi:MAG: M1 family aminopeptidase [Putridiphycobacter sp.]
MADKIHLEHMSHYDMSYLTYSASASMGADQPIDVPSGEYSQLNYGAIVYAKTGLEFNYLRNYLGDELFDKCMHAYYEQYEFKHPQPEDIKRVFEEVSGKNLDWFFGDIINTTKQIDYKIKKVKIDENGTTVTVKNKGQLDVPVRVDGYSLNELRNSKWIEPGNKKAKIHFDEKSFDEVKIDGVKKMPEINRTNNYWHKSGLLGKVEPVKFEFLGGDNEPDKTEIWYTPIMGYNVYDKFMIGALFHNITIPSNKFEYLVAPMFSFGRKNVSGFADFKYNYVPAKNFRMISVGVKGRTFKNELGGYRSEYMVANPYLNLSIGKPRTKKFYKQNLLIQGAYIFTKQYTNIGLTEVSKMGGYAKYNFDYKHRRQTFMAQLKVDAISEVESGRQLANLLLNASYKFKYLDKKKKALKKSIEIRAFLGQNLFRNFSGYENQYAFAPGGQTGNQDYFYDRYLMGRNELSGFFSQQRLNNQGGMNTTSTYGTNNNWLFTTNLYIELPYVPILGVYGDMGLAEIADQTEVFYDLGVGVRLFEGNFAAYFPIYESTNMKVPGQKYDQRIKFVLNLNALNPTEIIKKSL